MATWRWKASRIRDLNRSAGVWALRMFSTVEVVGICLSVMSCSRSMVPDSSFISF